MISCRRAARALLVVALWCAGACSGTTNPDTWSSAEAASAVVGEPLSPRIWSRQVWTGSELLNYGGVSVDTNVTTNMVTSIDPVTLDVTRVYDPPPFSASFGGSLEWIDDLVYFSGSQCSDDDKNSGRYPESNDCPYEAVLATLDPESGVWERLDLPPGTEDGIRVLGSVPDVGVLATAGQNPTRLWALTTDGDWTELPGSPLQETTPQNNERPRGYVVKGSCVLGDTVVQFGSERLAGTTGRDITAAVLDLGERDPEWTTSTRPELDLDQAPDILCGEDAMVFSPLTGPSGPIMRFSPDDESWTSICPSSVQPSDVALPFTLLGRPGSTGREVVYPGAPGVSSQIVDIATGEWRAGPPSAGLFEEIPTWIGTGFVGVSATGASGQFTTPEPMELPPTGTLFVFDVE